MTPGQDLELSTRVTTLSNVANGTVQAVTTPSPARGVYGSKPIADLFPDSTVLFGTYFCRITIIFTYFVVTILICFSYMPNPRSYILKIFFLTGDLVGFTSWSSAREPAQVFTLLETLFHAFDKAARKYGVFKGTRADICGSS